MTLKKCTKCGNGIDDNAIICQKCGMSLLAEEPKNDYETVKICIECGNPIDLKTGTCLNCGYNLEKVHNRNIKMIVSVTIGIAAIILLLTTIGIVIHINKGNAYIMDACEELAAFEGSLPNIEKIHISKEIDDGTHSISFVYRVCIEYQTMFGDERVLYIVDDKDERYFITENSSDRLTPYLHLSETEIYGFNGVFIWGDNWDELSSRTVRKFEKRFE